MVLKPESRWPLRLPELTVQEVLQRPLAATPTGSGRQGKLVSIVVVTFNNLVFNRLCLESVLANTVAESYELVVIDNGSQDGTVDYLSELANLNSHVRVLLNDQNTGFAAACNQGMTAASGETLLLLNNDTIVPPNWLTLLLKGLEDPAVGMVGPVTNRCGNEAQIDVPYSTYGEYLKCAEERAKLHRGEVKEIRMLTMFCVALRREVFESIGLLDERFAIGLFEDEDYSMRLRSAGYKLRCLDDVLVHHFGQATIGKLAVTDDYGKLFRSNRRKFEGKWKRTWHPHGRRPNHQYRDLVSKIRLIIESTLPEDSTVIVVSKGDEDLLTVSGRNAWHFPQDERGLYAGHYPETSTEAIEHLEHLRNEGAQFLIIPASMFWWLQYYSEFAKHLALNYRCSQHDDTCFIYQLTELGATEEDQQIRLCRMTGGIERLKRQLVTVVIPIFDDFEKVQQSVEWLLRNERHPYQLLLVDDSSSDPRIEALLVRCVDHNNHVAFAVTQNKRGIVAALNIGLKLAPGDVVILQPGSSMSRHWLEKMSACAYSRDAVATVSPVSGIAFYDEASTGVGKCVLITRAAIRKVGLFDDWRFSDSSAALADYCRRATAGNFVHLIDDTTFLLPLDPVEQVPSQKLVEGFERPCLLALIHSGSGGARFATEDLLTALSGSYRCLLLSTGSSEWSLHEVLGGELKLGHRYVFPLPWGLDLVLESDRERVLEDICESFKVDLVNIHHLLGSGPEIIELFKGLKLPIIFSFHDFYSLCPTAHLVDNDGMNCGGTCTEGAGECLVNQEYVQGKNFTLKHHYVHVHRDRMDSALAQCAAFTAPSSSTRNLLVKSLRSVVPADIHIIPHGSNLPRVRLATKPIGGQPAKLICMGNLNESKGVKLIEELMVLNAMRSRPFEFHFIGARPNDFRPEEFGGIHHGPYERGEYLQQIERIRPSFSLLAPICEETFSFTLSESWASGVPVFASNLGALKERIEKNGGGWLFEPQNATSFFDGMVTVLNTPGAWNNAIAEIEQIHLYSPEQEAVHFERVFRSLLVDRSQISQKGMTRVR